MSTYSAENNLVQLHVDEQGVASLTLNNPSKHNAFDDQMLADMLKILQQIAQDEGIHVVVLRAEGKNFSAGADLAWMQRMAKYSYDDNVADARVLGEVMHSLYRLPQPTVARIQGAAFGGAVGLAACCDIALATEDASFCLSEVKIGLIPAVISPFVIEAIGARAAKRYFQTAERFSAERALALGLVAEVVNADAIDDSLARMLSRLMNNSPKAMKAAKQLIHDVKDACIDDELMHLTAERIAAIRVSSEGQEGLNAFLEKRQPQWVNA